MLVPFFSAGLGTFVMVFYGGFRLRSRGHLIAAAGYLVALIGYIGGVGMFPIDSAPHNAVVGTHVVIWLVGIGHVLVLQHLVRKHADAAPPVVPSAAPANAMALAMAAARAQRRREAQQLVLQNPVAALELKIGRPDIPNRQYDDGGLVDVNHVPAPWLQEALEVTPEQAEQIITVREQRGGFLTAGEVLVHCPSIQPARFELIRDRVIVFPSDRLLKGIAVEPGTRAAGAGKRSRVAAWSSRYPEGEVQSRTAGYRARRSCALGKKASTPYFPKRKAPTGGPSSATQLTCMFAE
ncbi:hypothetical protein AB0G04_43535 [Actinoplanes sp. NPDC023801]|uniref:hypothetical protein n=1 Tax=Actinoplanes sp. NPDC023801 TaxID=3154595 RepID=UPI00340FB50E